MEKLLSLSNLKKYFCEFTDYVWERLCTLDFKTSDRDEDETWHEFYMVNFERVIRDIISRLLIIMMKIIRVYRENLMNVKRNSVVRARWYQLPKRPDPKFVKYSWPHLLIAANRHLQPRSSRLRRQIIKLIDHLLNLHSKQTFCL